MKLLIETTDGAYYYSNVLVYPDGTAMTRTEAEEMLRPLLEKLGALSYVRMEMSNGNNRYFNPANIKFAEVVNY